MFIWGVCCPLLMCLILLINAPYTLGLTNDTFSITCGTFSFSKEPLLIFQSGTFFSQSGSLVFLSATTDFSCATFNETGHAPNSRLLPYFHCTARFFSSTTTSPNPILT